MNIYDYFFPLKKVISLSVVVNPSLLLHRCIPSIRRRAPGAAGDYDLPSGVPPCSGEGEAGCGAPDCSLGP